MIQFILLYRSIKVYVAQSVEAMNKFIERQTQRLGYPVFILKDSIKQIDSLPANSYELKGLGIWFVE